MPAMGKKTVFAIVALALTGLVVYTSLNTGATYIGVGGRVGRWINEHLLFGALSEDEVWTVTNVGGKFVGHFLLFLLTGSFTWLFLKETKMPALPRTIVLLVYGLLLSCLGEAIQLSVEGRFGSLADVILNFSAYCFVPLWAKLKRDISPAVRG